VRGYRWNGALVEEWPLTLSPGDSTGAAPETSPLAGDVDGDGTIEVVALSPGGNVFAWNGVTGEELPGWPVSSDAGPATPWIGDADSDGELDLLTAGDSGRLVFYRLPYAAAPGALVWPTEAASPDGRAAYPDTLPVVDIPEEGRILAADRTYCYPNPARLEDVTVRFHLERAARVEVEVLDLTGQSVATFDVDGVRTANEVVWRAGDVPAGLYVVRVEAFDPDGGVTGRGPASESKLMKIAVIR
jgi:hypothetical protein